MKNLTILLTLIITVFVMFQSFAYANGPLVVKNAMAVTYGTRPFLYRYDKGSLGMFSNAEAISLIEELYKDWEAVGTAMITFQQDSPGSLDIDVTANNFDPILNSNSLLGYSPIVFDTDGSLLNAFLGNGAGNSVLGLSGPITVNSGPLANQIAESQAVFNGRFVNGINTPSDPESTVNSFMGTIIHETGHGIGLDHSQINVEAIKPSSGQEIRDVVPLMFPVAVNDLYLIRRDDAAGISLLYPNSTGLSGFGSIEGKIFRQDGTTPVLGANVIARNLTNPNLEAISCVSDFLTQSDGFFKFFAVPPGQYTIEIEPIDLSFTGGSGVGPYTTSKTDKSFQNPVPKGYYTGPNNPITTDKTQAFLVNVTAGQTIKDVNILASQTSTSSSTSSSTSGSTSSSSTSGSSSSTTSTSSSSSGPAEVNETEPNNSVNQAQVITIPVTILGNAAKGDPGELELSTQDNESVLVSDLFKFTLTEPDVINALLTFPIGSSDSDLDLILFNEDGSEIIDASSQNGKTNELVSTVLQSGTYLLGVGAFSGSTSYELSISKNSGSAGVPSITLAGPSTIVLSDQGMNKFNITADGLNFTSKTTCKIQKSNPTLLKNEIKSFMLTPVRTSKKVKFKIPFAKAIDQINNQTEETVTISVICSNGASDEFDILITPNVESVTETRKIWRIVRHKQ